MVVDFDGSSVLNSSSLPSPRVFQVLESSKSSSLPSPRAFQVLESSEYNTPKTRCVFESSSPPSLPSIQRIQRVERVIESESPACLSYRVRNCPEPRILFSG